MARPCAVCNHPSRAAIEQAILNQKSLSAIARDFPGFTYTRRKDGAQVPDHKIIQRHRDGCMPDAYQKAVEERELESGVAIAHRLRMLDDEVDKVIAAANKGRPLMVGDIPLLDEDGQMVMVHDWRLLLAAVDRARANVELLAKLSGRTETDPQELDAIRRHLESPQARRLLAELEKLAADADDPAPGRS
jgi:hypothetical protein